jgi:hypothetical protein
MSTKKKRTKRTRASVSISRAKKTTTKKKRGRPRTKPEKKRKVSKAERRATRSTQRKEETNNEYDIKATFSSETRKCTAGELAQLKLVFCRAYAKRGIISDGVTAAGINRLTLKRWRASDEDFNTNCIEAERMARDLLEREAMRRGSEGFDRPIIYKGKITGTYTDYSDPLLQTLLRGNVPSKYKDRTEHSTAAGKPLELEVETKVEVIGDILGLIDSKTDPD